MEHGAGLGPVLPASYCGAWSGALHLLPYNASQARDATIPTTHAASASTTVELLGAGAAASTVQVNPHVANPLVSMEPCCRTRLSVISVPWKPFVKMTNSSLPFK